MFRQKIPKKKKKNTSYKHGEKEKSNHMLLIGSALAVGIQRKENVNR